jgi:hypothetical protein
MHSFPNALTLSNLKATEKWALVAFINIIGPLYIVDGGSTIGLCCLLTAITFIRLITSEIIYICLVLNYKKFVVAQSTYTLPVYKANFLLLILSNNVLSISVFKLWSGFEKK